MTPVCLSATEVRGRFRFPCTSSPKVVIIVIPQRASIAVHRAAFLCQNKDPNPITTTAIDDRDSDRGGHDGNPTAGPSGTTRHAPPRAPLPCSDRGRPGVLRGGSGPLLGSLPLERPRASRRSRCTPGGRRPHQHPDLVLPGLIGRRANGSAGRPPRPPHSAAAWAETKQIGSRPVGRAQSSGEPWWTGGHQRRPRATGRTESSSR
jgi:hypothetical protein